MNDDFELLTPQLRAQIVGSVRAGGYPHVAAQAWGVSKAAFERWLAKGTGPEAQEPFESFARDLDDAFAQARLLAETSLYKDEPRIWLEHGPGRERLDVPGWSGPVKAAVGLAAPSNLFENIQLMAMCSRMLEALTPWPDARQRVSDALHMPTRT